MDIYIILSTLRWTCALVYLDDTIVFFTSLADHLGHVQKVPSRFQTARMNLRLTMCLFNLQSVYYLDHVMYPGNLAVTKRVLDAIAVMRPSRTVSQLCSFLGLFNAYRHIVPIFARTTDPLTSMSKKER